ncbi:uncharacterized protein BDZ99DRAFT_381482 [Mytilinidion resinicola]|uniref:Uncharacterized protein n=1 Tax=Mytilinidion resinicola TaxID=574789 RepID=A0A6A6YWJ7_9PEZI|nr:uncharacterized protein BDZ99DRAFT_381482 [Mytilinidion resinicola]KAF2813140.1 hypothetical protein BDZ99DRAFT_381482 [Mytilinidion resinicola]
MDELTPPRKSVELEDPGAHELVESSSDEHFSDASEGRKTLQGGDRSNAASPIPMTRVERVDDEPSYGEVPGTDAYQKRTQDAVPDEVEIVPDGARSRSTSRLRADDRPVTPGGSPVPKTVLEKVDDAPAHGEVPGTVAHQVRAADAVPDVILKVPQPPERSAEGSPTSSNRSPILSVHEAYEPELPDGPAASKNEHSDDHQSDGEGEDTGEFGDDFDDFEEGGSEDDFGDFDDGFQQEEEHTQPSFREVPPQPSIPVSSPGPPVLDFTDLLSLEQVTSATRSYVETLFPLPNETPIISMEGVSSNILSERSLSLWSQLVAPPPLQPPNWVRSRIRRLFLVSLGVPVDLDEILPASKQKKLILPSINIPGDRSPRPSSDERSNGAITRLKQGNTSSASVDSSASKAERKRRGPPPPPQLDISSTTMLCSTTEAALSNFTDDELRSHVQRLTELKQTGIEVVAYWTKRLESALGDKEAFEGVIENLVMHAKKVRK